MAVMHDMQVVIEIKQSADRAPDDHGRAPVRVGAGLMLGVGSHQRQRKAGVCEQQNVLPDSDVADESDRAQHDCNADPVADPDSQKAEVARIQAPQFECLQGNGDKTRNDDQPAEESVVERHDRAVERTHASRQPSRRQPATATRAAPRS